MLKISRETLIEILSATRYVQRIMRNPRGHRARYLGKHNINTSYFGKLDAALDYDDTTGVTVSIWSYDLSEDTGDNISNVLPPPTMESGTIDSGSWVKIELIQGRWYVTLAPC